MTKQQPLDSLMTRLHEQFATQPASAEQREWLDQLQHGTQEPNAMDTANYLLESLEEDHPQAAAIVREILETLGRLGI